MKVLILCGALSAVEAIDIYIVASVLPVLARIYGVQPAAFAAVFVAQAIGQTLGSCFGAPLADRVGRRPVILLSVVAFGVLTFAAAFATSLALLVALRCLALAFVGAAQPNLFALAGEFAAPANRHRFMLAIGSIHALGGGMAALISAWLLGLSWHAPLALSAAVTLLLAALAWRWLPESLAYLAARADARPEPLRVLIRKMDASQSLEEIPAFCLEERPERSATLRSLFTTGRRLSTGLLWLTTACSLPLLTTIGQWLPTFLHVYGGLEVRVAAAMTSLSGVSAALWPLALMFAMDRLGVARGLALNLFIGAVALLTFSAIGHWPAIGWFIGFAFGAFVAGSVTGVYALVAQSYPTQLRATGLGWSMGAARIVAILLPSMGGAALATGASAGAVALSVAAPLSVAAVASLLLSSVSRARTASTQ